MWNVVYMKKIWNTAGEVVKKTYHTIKRLGCCCTLAEDDSSSAAEPVVDDSSEQGPRSPRILFWPPSPSDSDDELATNNNGIVNATNPSTDRFDPTRPPFWPSEDDNQHLYFPSRSTQRQIAKHSINVLQESIQNPTIPPISSMLYEGIEDEAGKPVGPIDDQVHLAQQQSVLTYLFKSTQTSIVLQPSEWFLGRIEPFERPNNGEALFEGFYFLPPVQFVVGSSSS
jgi:hypothetical protein